MSLTVPAPHSLTNASRQEQEWRSPYLSWIAIAWPLTPDSPGSPSAAMLDAARDLCQTAWTRPEGTTEALRRFGAAAGNEGWAVEGVFTWISQLIPHVPRRVRRLLDSTESHRALAEGWAAEFVRGSRACVDPTTGITTREVLAARLDETYRFCEQSDIDVTMAFVLVIADVAASHLELAGVLALAGQQISAEFVDGETAAYYGSRFFVLCSAAMVNDERLHRVHDRLVSVGADHSLVWCEPLPGSRTALERFLADCGLPDEALD